MSPRAVLAVALLLLLLAPGCCVTWRGSLGMELEPPPGLCPEPAETLEPNEALTTRIRAVELDTKES